MMKPEMMMDTLQQVAVQGGEVDHRVIVMHPDDALPGKPKKFDGHPIMYEVDEALRGRAFILNAADYKPTRTCDHGIIRSTRKNPRHCSRTATETRTIYDGAFDDSGFSVSLCWQHTKIIDVQPQRPQRRNHV